MKPKLLIADEPIASLDVTTQAQMVKLFRHLQREHDCAILFIAHDLSMVRLLCDRVGVMKDGKLVEIGETEQVFEHPQHLYTKKLLEAIPIPEISGEEQRDEETMVFVLSLLVFVMSRLAPGDPLVSYYGERAERMSVEEHEHAMERLGLNEPIPVQYVKWLGNAFQGEYGISYKYKQDVLTVIEGRLVNTLLLGGIGFILTFGLALLLGIFCVYYENQLLDRILRKVGTITSCIPEFWLSLILILIFSVNLKLLPGSGAYDLGQSANPLSRLTHLILPLTVVVLSHLWYYAYLIRNRLLEETRKDYVLLAKAKGMSRKRVLFFHCVKNIMPSFISLMAISLQHVIEGTYIVEMVFSYPGIGTLSFESAKYHDYNMLMVLCVFTGIFVIAGNVIGQSVSEWIDPRMKELKMTGKAS